jgi:hypothetical protein
MEFGIARWPASRDCGAALGDRHTCDADTSSGVVMTGATKSHSR